MTKINAVASYSTPAMHTRSQGYRTARMKLEERVARASGAGRPKVMAPVIKPIVKQSYLERITPSRNTIVKIGAVSAFLSTTAFYALPLLRQLVVKQCTNRIIPC